MSSAMIATSMKVNVPAAAAAAKGRTALPSRAGIVGTPLVVARRSARAPVGRSSTRVLAATLPQGVKEPTDVPKLSKSWIGFTQTAEKINGRAAMIGIFALFLVEGIIGKPFLDFIGIETGNGIDIAF